VAACDYEGSIRDIASARYGTDTYVDYSAFGQDGTLPVDALFGYIGSQYDRETGLSYLKARYYDPAQGRFLSPDPLGFSGGDANLYRYAGNDPINRSDPSGLRPGFSYSPPSDPLVSLFNGLGTAAGYAQRAVSQIPISSYVANPLLVSLPLAVSTLSDVAETGRQVAVNTLSDRSATLLQRSGITFGTIAASQVGVRGLDELIAGSDAVSGQRLGWGQRLWRGVTGAISLAGTALSGASLATATTRTATAARSAASQADDFVHVADTGYHAVVAGAGIVDTGAPFASYGASSTAAQAGRIHGNSLASPRTAYLYRLEDAQGNFLKWGVTQDMAKRYPKSFFVDGKQMVPWESGSRADMIRMERGLVETQPGPLNFERWAGSRLGEQP
jgi:RHS repeat-associated protein